MKYLKKFKSSIEKFIDISKIDWDYHLLHNLDNHSKYKKGKSISYMVNVFENELNNFITNNTITLYRKLALKNENSLKYPYGIFWSFKEDFAQIIDDENYEGERGDKPFILKGIFDIKDIDWTSTFNIYLMNDFMECEIRTKQNSKPLKIDIYLSKW